MSDETPAAILDQIKGCLVAGKSLKVSHVCGTGGFTFASADAKKELVIGGDAGCSLENSKKIKFTCANATEAPIHKSSSNWFMNMFK
jgi:hypothetical protein